MSADNNNNRNRSTRTTAANANVRSSEAPRASNMRYRGSAAAFAGNDQSLLSDEEYNNTIATAMAAPHYRISLNLTRGLGLSSGGGGYGSTRQSAAAGGNRGYYDYNNDDYEVPTIATSTTSGGADNSLSPDSLPSGNQQPPHRIVSYGVRSSTGVGGAKNANNSPHHQRLDSSSRPAIEGDETYVGYLDDERHERAAAGGYADNGGGEYGYSNAAAVRASNRRSAAAGRRSTFGGGRGPARRSAAAPPAGDNTGYHTNNTGFNDGEDDDDNAGTNNNNTDNTNKPRPTYHPITIMANVWYDLRDFFNEIVEGYGGKFVAMLAIVYFCMKGLSNNATSAAMLPFYKTSLNIPSTEYQKYFNVANMSFSLKPLVGLVSDLLPIGGYSKRYYVAMIALGSTASLAVIAAWAAGQGNDAAGPITAALFFTFFLGIAGTDLLMEGKYSELMNMQKAPPSIITFVWLCFSLGALAGALLEGPLADKARAEVILIIAAPFASLPAIFALLGWIPEKKRRGKDGAVMGGCGCLAGVCSCFGCCGSKYESVDRNSNTNGYVVFDGAADNSSTGKEQHASSTPLKGVSTSNKTDAYLLSTSSDGYGASSPTGSPSASMTTNPNNAAKHANDSSDAPSSPKEESAATDSKTAAAAEGDDVEGYEAPPQGWYKPHDAWWLQKLRSPTGLAFLGAATASASLIMALITLLSTNMVLLYFIAPAAVCLLAASFVILPRAAAMANLFMFLRELFYLQITGPLDYFYTATPTCLPDGPHFSYSYYQTLVSFLGAAGTMVGTIIFQRFLSRMTFMRVFWVSTSLKIGASVFDLVMTRRWNTEYLGISDEVMFLCGDAIIYPICTMLDFMPTTVLLSRLCPRGMESTMFALLASFNNFGASISRAIGYIVAEKLEIKSNGDDCDFKNLWWLVVIGHMIMPSMVYFFSCALMPDTPMTTPIAEVVAVGGGANGGLRETFLASMTDDGEGGIIGADGQIDYAALGSPSSYQRHGRDGEDTNNATAVHKENNAEQLTVRQSNVVDGATTSADAPTTTREPLTPKMSPMDDDAQTSAAPNANDYEVHTTPTVSPQFSHCGDSDLHTQPRPQLGGTPLLEEEAMLEGAVGGAPLPPPTPSNAN